MRFFVFIFFLCLAAETTGQIHVLKFNTSSSAVLSPGVAYEHVRDKQFSWQLSASMRLPVEKISPLLTPLKENRALSNFKLNGYSISGEYRFYTTRAKKDLAKPYISPFVRYYNYGGDLRMNEDAHIYNLDATWQTASVGIQYGVQWVFNNSWSIDLTLVGIGLSRSQLVGSLVTDHPDPNIGLLEDDFLSIPFIGSRFNFTGNEGTYKLDEAFTTVAFRTALYIGILF